MLDQLMAALRRQRRGPRPVGSEVGVYNKEGKWVPTMIEMKIVPDLNSLRAPYRTAAEAGFPPDGILPVELSGSESPGGHSTDRGCPGTREELAWKAEDVGGGTGLAG